MFECVCVRGEWDHYSPNELTKTMTDEEFQIVKMWVNEILTEDTSRHQETMNGTISQLHKGHREARIDRRINDQ